MKRSILALALGAAFALPAQAQYLATPKWTYTHSQFRSEIGAFASYVDGSGATRKEVWTVGPQGIDILDAFSASPTGTLLGSITGAPVAGVNSIAIFGNTAAVAISNATKTDPGLVRFFDLATRTEIHTAITVGANPDQLTFTPDGSKLLVANEGEAQYNNTSSTGVVIADAPGSVSIISMTGTPALIATADFSGFTVAGLQANGVRIQPIPGTPAPTDAQKLAAIEPEYISVSADGSRALVTLQENNAVAVLDLNTNSFTSVLGLGEKDFRATGNFIDPKDANGIAILTNPTPTGIQVKGLYMPDAIASYTGPDGKTYYVIANEGDAEDSQLVRAASGGFGVTAADDLNRLNVLRDLSSSTKLVGIGGRSISILDENGLLVSDSGNSLETNLISQFPTLYNDARSDDKGVEPEGVSVMAIGGRTLAFVGLERAGSVASERRSVVAVYDVTDPTNMVFQMFIRSSIGQMRAEGVQAFQDGGKYYLLVNNEGPDPDALATPFTTNLYEIQPVPAPEAWALMGAGLLALVPLVRRRRV